MKKISENIFAIEPFPALYISDLDCTVIADLHLGYETIASECGVFVPRVQFEKSMQTVEKIVNKKKTKRIILLGDIKHEFSGTSYHEYREVSAFLDFLSIYFVEIIIVKGNHDTFIHRVAKKYRIEVFDAFVEKDYLFVHGHKDMDIKKVEEDKIIMGHEHPSIALFTDIGVKEKLRCFLYGKAYGKEVIVLPAFSFFAEGSDVNLIPKEELLSPVLRKIDIDSFKVIGIIEGDSFLEFPSVGKLRRFV